MSDNPKPIFPSLDKLREARAEAERANASPDIPPGTVIGLPADMQPYVLPTDMPESRKASLRLVLQARGYLPVPEPMPVAGYPLPCEIWVALRKDAPTERAAYETRAARRS